MNTHWGPGRVKVLDMVWEEAAVCPSRQLAFFGVHELTMVVVGVFGFEILEDMGLGMWSRSCAATL